MNDLRNVTSEGPLVIWRLLDGKPGHENQSLGLCDALARRLTVERHDIRVRPRLAQLFELLSRRFAQGERLPRPALIIGAGHHTHIAMLAARRRYAGRCVVLMGPSLPLALFDLCLIPQHDGVTGENVMQTRGALNAVTSAEPAPHGPLLFLIGGPSRHFDWQDEAVLEQIRAVAERNSSHSCVLADSRRTPSSFIASLQRAMPANLSLMPWQQAAPGWLAMQFGKSRAAWVTEDSVSMVYEALTAGLPVGLFELPPRHNSRVAAGIGQLKQQAWVTGYSEWIAGGVLQRQEALFNEADRCAGWMLNQWQ